MNTRKKYVSSCWGCTLVSGGASDLWSERFPVRSSPWPECCVLPKGTSPTLLKKVLVFHPGSPVCNAQAWASIVLAYVIMSSCEAWPCWQLLTYQFDNSFCSHQSGFLYLPIWGPDSWVGGYCSAHGQVPTGYDSKTSSLLMLYRFPTFGKPNTCFLMLCT